MSKVLDEKLEKMSSEEQKMWALRHTAEHVLHTALQNLYPKMLKAMGPATDEGYYHDFDLDEKITEADFERIEKEMQRIIDMDLPVVQEYIDEKRANEIFEKNHYKMEWVNQIAQRGEKFSTYKIGDIDLDLCSGPHVKSTGEVKAFKLLKVAGAYWPGDAKNKMLQRVYGPAFGSKEELDAYLNNLAEAEKRDHKKLARELDLIVFSDLVGAGLPLYTPKGALLRSAVYNFSRELNTKIGYNETSLPNMNKAELFKVSGHYDKYKDDMFEVKSHYSKDEFFLKPMNCPQHCVLFGSRSRSYRDLPIRYSDFSVLYRDEKPGEINGILRSRAFTQDDGHCFCREDQIETEFSNVLSAIAEALKAYGFKYWVRLSLHDPAHFEKYLGTPEIWETAESKLRAVVEKAKVEYKEGLGEAAIYGPKLDFMAIDSIGREWQISTIQLDLNMPGRFGLVYADSDGTEKTPIMIHRAIIGSERFIGILIEHFAGAFPMWLSPVQVQLLPIADRHLDFAKQIQVSIIENGIRVELDGRSEKLGAKIRDAQMQKVPYMIIIGDKEIESKAVAVRKRDGTDLGSLPLQNFIDQVKIEIIDKTV
ncbi:threonine--tRNA ligase [Candidatus Microgenomates bacterium]|nr:threonine--tRNA ligase [Candidatus Microgenomates bacterium]